LQRLIDTAPPETLEDALAGLDARLVNVVHDELVLEVAEGDATAVKAAVERAMVEGFLAVFPDGAGVTAGLVEAKAGPNWAAAK
jgi:DNA polymerase I-like protein with 3'-5' exonuclease and polymerase domains